MAHQDRVWGLLAALVLATALGASTVRAQETSAPQGSGAPGDAKPAEGQTSESVRVTTQGEKKTSLLANARDVWSFLYIEFGFMDEIIAENRAEEAAEDQERAQMYESMRAEGTSQGGAGDSVLKFVPDPKADPQFATQSALEGMADRLEELGLKELSRALRDLAHKIRLAPQTSGPAPISLWIQGRPPGSGSNPGGELAFHVSQVSTFQAAGVALLSNTWAAPNAWPGAVYAEPDQARTVAVAPSLDPAHWPAAAAAPLSLTLELEMPIP